MGCEYLSYGDHVVMTITRLPAQILLTAYDESHYAHLLIGY